MPEKYGVVAAKSPYGVKLDDNKEWWNWSNEDYRGEPFDEVEKGDRVRVEYSESTKQGVTKVYISVIERLDGGEPAYPEDMPFDQGSEPPQDFPAEVTETRPGDREWTWRHKDALMAKESAYRDACMLYAAALQGGILKALPEKGAVQALAKALFQDGTSVEDWTEFK